jgi:hypothetical protein
MAKVLKVFISVVAPEKSIVPWAWATPANESTRRVGAIARMAERSVVLRVCPDSRLADGISSRLRLASRRKILRSRFTLHLR